jgi:hypothetical protein
MSQGIARLVIMRGLVVRQLQCVLMHRSHHRNPSKSQAR